MNRRVFRDAESRALLCNVVDVPELCSFILPAVHRHEPIAVAVSTGGASPALAQHLRDQIATVVRPEHAELAHRLRELRPWAKSHFATYEERKAYFAGLVAEELGNDRAPRRRRPRRPGPDHRPRSRARCARATCSSPTCSSRRSSSTRLPMTQSSSPAPA